MATEEVKGFSVTPARVAYLSALIGVFMTVWAGLGYFKDFEVADMRQDADIASLKSDRAELKANFAELNRNVIGLNEQLVRTTTILEQYIQKADAGKGSTFVRINQ